jgi:hypothetical protein
MEVFKAKLSNFQFQSIPGNAVPEQRHSEGGDLQFEAETCLLHIERTIFQVQFDAKNVGNKLCDKHGDFAGVVYPMSIFKPSEYMNCKLIAVSRGRALSQ